MFKVAGINIYICCSYHKKKLPLCSFPEVFSKVIYWSQINILVIVGYCLSF